MSFSSMLRGDLKRRANGVVELLDVQESLAIELRLSLPLGEEVLGNRGRKLVDHGKTISRRLACERTSLRQA